MKRFKSKRQARSFLATTIKSPTSYIHYPENTAANAWTRFTRVSL
jgi:hypothetical protein